MKQKVQQIKREGALLGDIVQTLVKEEKDYCE